jgi:hypothetical protein
MVHTPRSRRLYRWPAFAVACCLIAAALCIWSPAARAEPSSPPQTAASTTGFSDIAGDEWYAEAVLALAGEGVVLRNWDGSFRPDDAPTRAQMAYTLARLLELEPSPGQPFFDVRPTNWFAGAVGALFQRGVIEGTSLVMFSPDRPLSKQEAAAWVVRALESTNRQGGEASASLNLTEDQAPAWLAAFRDRGFIDPAYTVPVANAYRLGILDDRADGWLFPTGDLTRAEMAVMLARAFLEPVSPKTAYPEERPAVETYDPLSVGSKGPLVSFLEARLTALRYPCGPVDGVYDYRTKDAVMAFEKVERLKRDGKVGAKVWQRFLTAQTPSPRKSGVGTRCEVDLSRQVLFMITDNKVTKVVHISSGRNGTRTGHFAIQEKYKGWVEAITVTGRMYYPSYVVSLTAIHGYKSVPPYPASHGCVRTPVWITVELFYELPTGTPVDIYY